MLRGEFESLTFGAIGAMLEVYGFRLAPQPPASLDEVSPYAVFQFEWRAERSAIVASLEGIEIARQPISDSNLTEALVAADQAVIAALSRRRCGLGSGALAGMCWDGAQRPLVELLAVAMAQENLTRARASLVAAARSEGATWTQIGAALGVSRQAAAQAHTARPEAAAYHRVLVDGFGGTIPRQYVPRQGRKRQMWAVRESGTSLSLT